MNNVDTCEIYFIATIIVISCSGNTSWSLPFFFFMKMEGGFMKYYTKWCYDGVKSEENLMEPLLARLLRSL